MMRLRLFVFRSMPMYLGRHARVGREPPAHGTSQQRHRTEDDVDLEQPAIEIRHVDRVAIGSERGTASIDAGRSLDHLGSHQGGGRIPWIG